MRSKLNLLASAGALAALLAMGGMPLLAARPQPAAATQMQQKKTTKKTKKTQKKSQGTWGQKTTTKPATPHLF